MPPDPAPVRLLRGAVAVVVVVFLCFTLEPVDDPAAPAPRGAADFEPTAVDDAGAGYKSIHEK